jgi:hypothetical protein
MPKQTIIIVSMSFSVVLPSCGDGFSFDEYERFNDDHERFNDDHERFDGHDKRLNGGYKRFNEHNERLEDEMASNATHTSCQDISRRSLSTLSDVSTRQ